MSAILDVPNGGPVGARYKQISQMEIAYQRLRHGLTTLAYKPGDYLNVSALMDEVGTGRTPIVQALHRLEGEGLISILPRKGVMVTPLSLDEALHLTEARLANETLCARLAAARIEQNGIERLEEAASRIADAIHARDVALMLQFDKQFHELINMASGNPVLVEILGVLQARSQRFWALSLSNEEHLAEVLQEHEDVLSALKRRDGEAAASAIRKHIESFQSSLLRGKPWSTAVGS